MVSARDELAAAAVSTPRVIARVRGKALHYGCAIPFVAVATPSISQLMHIRETGTGPVAVPSLDDEKEAEFDWDRKLWVSERARRALEFMRTVMEKYGNVGQPLWPLVPSSLYGAGEERDTRILVIHHLRRQGARLGGGPGHGPGRARRRGCGGLPDRSGPARLCLH